MLYTSQEHFETNKAVIEKQDLIRFRRINNFYETTIDNQRYLFSSKEYSQIAQHDFMIASDKYSATWYRRKELDDDTFQQMRMQFKYFSREDKEIIKEHAKKIPNEWYREVNNELILI